MSELWEIKSKKKTKVKERDDESVRNWERDTLQRSVKMYMDLFIDLCARNLWWINNISKSLYPEYLHTWTIF